MGIPVLAAALANPYSCRNPRSGERLARNCELHVPPHRVKFFFYKSKRHPNTTDDH